MSIGEKFGQTALELVKNENVQNKAVDFLGMLFPYAGLTKKAVEMYVSEIEKSDMSTEAKMIAMMHAKKTLKKMKNQKRVADIAIENAKEGTDFTEKSGVNEEWLERFMEAASFVSAEDIQLIWGKILANEFEKPGSTPPNMIRVLSEITPSLAAAFRKICSMKVQMCPLRENRMIANIEEEIIVPFSGHAEKFGEIGVSFVLLNELETLGVIKFEGITGYVTVGIEYEEILLKVHDEMFLFSKNKKDAIPVGNVMLTSVGQALQKITTEEDIPDYYEEVKQYFKANGVKILENQKLEIVTEGDIWWVVERKDL